MGAHVVRHPALELEARAEGYFARHPTFGYETPIEPALGEVLDACRAPRSADSLYELGVSAELLCALLDTYLLIPTESMETLGRGIQEPAARPVGDWLSLARLPEKLPGQVCFVGAPCELGGGFGASRGADMLRMGFPHALTSPRAAHATHLQDPELSKEYDVGSAKYWDCGNVPCRSHDEVGSKGV